MRCQKMWGNVINCNGLLAKLHWKWRNVTKCYKNVHKCWPKMSWNVKKSSANVIKCYIRVSGGGGMLSNVTTMLINVGNGMLKMWSNVGQKCHGMWGISSPNVIKCWIYGIWRWPNVSECFQNVKKCWKWDVKNVIKCWPKMSWNVRDKFDQCYQMLDLW